jgi:hypothetical protein
MSFIYSRALVEASLQGKCSDTAVSALLSGNHIPPLFLPKDKTTAFSRLSRFGMTFGHLTDDLGAALLTSWLEGFPAKTSAALQEKAQASPERDLACGPTWRASLAKFDPVSSSWKTVQLSLLGDLELSSVTWPRSGMTAGGRCWELPTLGRRISGTGFGFLLPTPSASEPELERRQKHGTHYTTATGTKRRMNEDGTTSNLGLAASAQTWPTPTAVAKFRTPNHSDGRKWSNDTQAEREAQGRQVMLCHQLQTGGSLNPQWVEWLMGWPLRWTDLKPSETVNSPSAPQLHSESCLSLFKEPK